MTRIAAALPLLLLLAACGGDDEAATQWAVEPPPFPEVVMVRRLDPDAAAGTARMSGTLVVRDGCLRADAGERSWLLLWPAEARLAVAAPHDVSVDGDPGKDQQMVRVGEVVNFGGAALAGETAASVGPDGAIATSAAFPEACDGPLWAVGGFGPQDG